MEKMEIVTFCEIPSVKSLKIHTKAIHWKRFYQFVNEGPMTFDRYNFSWNDTPFSLNCSDHWALRLPVLVTLQYWFLVVEWLNIFVIQRQYFQILDFHYKEKTVMRLFIFLMKGICIHVRWHLYIESALGSPFNTDYLSLQLICGYTWQM